MSDDPLADGIAALSRFFVGSGTLAETLVQVSQFACEAMSADMAGITMLVDGVATTAVFTDPEAPEIDSEQYSTGEGPCLDAWRRQVINRIDDTEIDQRWPAFAAGALRHGMRSSLSMPLTTSWESLGALNIYSRRPENFLDKNLARAELWAAAAATVLANASAYHDSRALNENLREALTSRATIDQAVGILIAQARCTPTDAFQILVRASQRENRKLRDIASDLVDDAVVRNSPLPEA